MEQKPYFKYDIVKQFGTVGTSGSVTKELNLISYNGSAAKFDLRAWETAENGTRSMRKGITLTAEELARLRDLIAGIDLDEDIPK